MTVRTSTYLVCFLFAAGCASERGSVQASYLVISGATIIDGTGAEPIRDGLIVLEGERIVEIGSASEIVVPDDAEVVSADGAWVIPGMIDVHMHFWESGRPGAQPTFVADLTALFPYDAEVAWMKGRTQFTLGRYLCSGVTSVAALGAIPWEYEVRDMANAMPAAPRVFLAGGFVGNSPPEESSPFWEGEQPGYWIEDADAARQVVSYLDSTGVDLIKAGYVSSEDHPLSSFRPALHALVEESRARGLRVSVHANELETARMAVEVGADVLAHTVTDREVDDDFIRALKASGVITTTSAGVRTGHARLLATDFQFKGTEERCGDPQVIESWLEWSGTPIDARPELPPGLGGAQVLEDQMVANLRLLNEADARIAVGSDGGNIGSMHGPSFQNELRLLAKAGLTPMQVIVAATQSGAAALGVLDDLGTLEQGKVGDLVILDANPLASVDNLARVAAIVVRGTYITSDEIDQIGN
jgi:imidazolonepropionase-like amidohydrolase